MSRLSEPQYCETWKSLEGKQRYQCRNLECTRSTFVQQYSYRGYLKAVKQQIVDMAVSGSGIRDTARVLRISTTTVLEELKKVSTSDCGQSASPRKPCPSRTSASGG